MESAFDYNINSVVSYPKNYISSSSFSTNNIQVKAKIKGRKLYPT